jgi:hypothetical protein
MAVMEAWVSISIGAVAGLYLALFVSFHNVRRERDELRDQKLAPKPLKIRTDPMQLLTGLKNGHVIFMFTRVWITNPNDWAVDVAASCGLQLGNTSISSQANPLPLKVKFSEMANPDMFGSNISPLCAIEGRRTVSGHLYFDMNWMQAQVVQSSSDDVLTFVVTVEDMNGRGRGEHRINLERERLVTAVHQAIKINPDVLGLPAWVKVETGGKS